MHGLGWREFDILELNGLPQRLVVDRLLRADIIHVGGGNKVDVVSEGRYRFHPVGPTAIPTPHPHPAARPTKARRPVPD